MTASKTQTNANEIRIVLIVSQDSKMAAVWEALFKQRCYYVVHENSPRHALQAAHLLSPALIILDLDIPQSERLDLCKRLRPMTHGALFLLTPKVNDDEIKEYVQIGVDERLSPTVSPATLLSKSLTWLAQ